MGTRAKVEEISIPDGYTVGYWEGESYDDGVVSIAKDAVSAVVVHNHYAPKEVHPVNVTVEGEKILTGRKWLSTDSFTVQLQKFEGGAWKVLAEKRLIRPTLSTWPRWPARSSPPWVSTPIRWWS